MGVANHIASYITTFAVKPNPVRLKTTGPFHRSLATLLIALAFLAIFPFGALAQSQPSDTETQVRPEADLRWQLPHNLSVISFSGVEQGVDYSYQQWYVATGLGYQFKPILRPHRENIDPDKEHYLVFGGGYEYLRTVQSGVVKHENRFNIDFTPGYRLPYDFLIPDRNWIELRWIGGAYSTTYRNMLSLEHDVVIRGFHFVPYGSAESFYDGAKHDWKEQYYTGGIEWPYKKSSMIDTFIAARIARPVIPANGMSQEYKLQFLLRPREPMSTLFRFMRRTQEETC
jgi:hypothetical protein